MAFINIINTVHVSIEMTKIRIYVHKRNFLIGWRILQLDINIRYVLMYGTFLADYFLF